MEVHKTAIVSSKAKLGNNVIVGPYSIIKEGVTVGENVVIGSSCVLTGNTTIGSGCQIFTGAVIGSIPQDKKFDSLEKVSLEIGENNIFREYVTVNPGTGDGGATCIGNENLFMACSHVAHDCIVGSNCIMANSCALAGHVTMEDRAVIGGLSAVHQFSRLGKLSIVGGCSKVVQDIPPFSTCDGHPARVYGLNSVGIRRLKIPKTTVDNLKRAFKILFQSGLTKTHALEKIAQEIDGCAEIDQWQSNNWQNQKRICQNCKTRTLQLTKINSIFLLSMQNQKIIGLIAGNGKFPLLFAHNACKHNIKVIAVAIKGDTSFFLRWVVNELLWVGPGELKKLFEFFKRKGVKQVIMAGQVNPKNLFDDNVVMDDDAKLLFAAMQDRKADTIFLAVAQKLQNEGMELIDSVLLLKEYMAPKGTLTKRGPTETELADIEFGRNIAKTMGSIDVGQTVVVKEKAILAIEAMEGTDRTIIRGGNIANQGAVVVKMSKPNQDNRFDVPVIGPRTINAMVKSKSGCIAVEAGKTLLIDRDKCVRIADKSGICIVAA